MRVMNAQILQYGRLSEVDSVRDTVGHHEGRCQVIDLSCFSRVGSERKGIYSRQSTTPCDVFVSSVTYESDDSLIPLDSR